MIGSLNFIALGKKAALITNIEKKKITVLIHNKTSKTRILKFNVPVKFKNPENWVVYWSKK